MPNKSQKFRVFVSSTFSDLKAERNALQERVFPRIRALAAEHGRGFQVIDLRWGVSDQASLDQQAMQICLNEIDRCQQISPRPNFIVLLGDRYGWSPPPARILDDHFRQLLGEVTDPADRALLEAWYVLDENAVPAELRLKPRLRGGAYEAYENWEPVETRLQGLLSAAARSLGFKDDALLPFTASATEQEIAAGALQVGDAPEHVFCFFRSVHGFPDQFDGGEFFAKVAEWMQEDYPEGLPNDDCRSIWKGIRALNGECTAGQVNLRIRQFLEATPRGTLAWDFLQALRGWLSDFTARDFLNLDSDTWRLDEDALSRQNALKDRLGKHVAENTYRYRAQWTGRGITSTHIDELCEDVYRSLSTVILAQIENPPPLDIAAEQRMPIAAPRALDDVGREHRRFAVERLQHFLGRTEILEKIEAYLSGENACILTIHGAGGTGKSALTAKAIQAAQQAHPGAAVIYRFIGATPGSAEGRVLLDGLCREISRWYKADEADIPLDYQALVPELGERLALATAKQPLILFLDSLDQLSSMGNARNLAWLPTKLPAHVRVVATTRPEDILGKLKDKGARLEELGGLSRAEGGQLLKSWLREAGRTLQQPQEKEVLDAFQTSGGAPLYLKLAFEEARQWPSGDGEVPKALAVDITGIIEKNLIDRLAQEGNHGQVLVSSALGYLAASRYGLAEDEVVDLLSRDLQVYRWFLEGSYHLPADLVSVAATYRVEKGLAKQREGLTARREAVRWLQEIRTPPEALADFLKAVLPRADGPRLPIVLWSRFSLDLAPYLSQHVSEGSVLMTFYHRELGDVAQKLFLEAGRKQTLHLRLADYFRCQADPEGDASWAGSSTRGLSELPYHLTEAEAWDGVYETLTDFRFLERKAAQVGVVENQDEDGMPVKTYTGVFQLQEDYERALAAMPGEGGAVSGREKHPLIITAVDRGKGLTLYCPVCKETSPIEEDRLDRVITCPGSECKARLKINPFVTEMA